MEFSQYVERCRQLIGELTQIVSAFRSVAVLDSVEFRQIDTQSPNLGELLALSLNDHAREYRESYAGLSPDGAISPKTRCTTGWRQRFYPVLDTTASGPAVAEGDGGFALDVSGGGSNPDFSGLRVSLELPADRFTDCHTPAFFLDWIHRVESIDGEIAASFETRDFSKAVLACVAPRDGEDPHSRWREHWIRYFPIPDLLKCLPQDLQARSIGTAVLIQATEKFPDATNTADIDAGKRVRAALANLGLAEHWTHVMFGWPPDREEQIYCEYVTRAPPDRKYRVRCVDFDGYDHERKVLLTVRLFRLLEHYKPAHGFRTGPAQVINEACRQLHAVGNDSATRIEWRIGLKGAFEGVCAVLDRYLPEHKGKIEVIYQPLEDVLHELERERNAEGKAS
jgi:hypothetical protein